MRDVRNRHVERELERIVPIEISVKYSSPETFGLVVLAVGINSLSTAQEFFATAKEMAIVIEVLDVYLKTSVADVLNKVQQRPYSVPRAPPGSMP